MFNYSVGISGLGKYIPSTKKENGAIEHAAGLPDGYILEKTGIKSRFVADGSENASDMGYSAALMALQNAGISSKKLSLIICCTFTGDYVYPALSCKLQQMLGADGAGTFDVMANCTGFQVGLSVASDKMLADASLEYVLVVGVALQSRFIDWTDPSSSIYFGDGAGAAVLTRVPKEYGFRSHQIITNSAAYEAVRMRGGGSSFPMTKDNISDGLQFYELNGLEVWKQAITFQPKAIRGCLEKINKGVADVDFFILHQANVNLIEYQMKRMGKTAANTLINVDKYGNTADASMAIAFCEAVENGLLNRGDLVVLSGIGAGFVFGASALIWY